MSPSPPTVTESLFRASKRRKVFRRWDDSAETDSPPSHLHDSNTPSTARPGRQHSQSPSDSEEPPLLDSGSAPARNASIADLLRQRKLAKARRGGIEFSRPSTTSGSRNEEDQLRTALVPLEEQASIVDEARNRFAPQMGTVTESNNEHMTAFIDAEIARLRAQDRARIHAEREGSSAHPISTSPAGPSDRVPQQAPTHPTRAPTSHGQIQEIDLGPNSTARNIALTSAATSRLSGTSLEPPPDEPAPPHRVRLGRDGKPLPRRSRKRRDSADLARDAAVEAVLRENGLGLYESGAVAVDAFRTHAQLDDVTADDLLAQQFEREYLEAVQERESLRKPAPPPGPPPRPGEKVSELAKGPKLGGSRSARAAMHAKEKEREAGRKAGR